MWGALSDERTGLSFTTAAGPRQRSHSWVRGPAQSFLGSRPVALVTIFYCLRFETSLFVASYDSQGHGGGIRPSAGLGSLLYSPWVDTTENTTPNNCFIVAVGGCLVIARISLTYLSAVTKKQLLSHCLF
jgi:hypothetical protein